jgi:hypothetical protein
MLQSLFLLLKATFWSEGAYRLVLSENIVTADFAKLPGSGADGAGKRPSVAVLDAAKWPEWGVEKWEETESPEHPLDSPALFPIPAAAEPEQKDEVSQQKRERGERLPEPLASDTGTAKSQAAEAEGQTGPPKPQDNLLPPRPAAATPGRIKLGIVAGLLFLGGLLSLGGFKMWAADLSALSPAPSVSTVSVDLSASSPVEAPSDAAVPADAASPGADTAPPTTSVPAARVTEVAAEPPPAAADRHSQTRPLAHRVRLNTVIPPAQSNPTPSCVRVYPELGHCHSAGRQPKD